LMASLMMIVFWLPTWSRTEQLVYARIGRVPESKRSDLWVGRSFDVKLRSGMEISDLMPHFMQNHDRILPEMIEKDDQVWKYALFSTKAGKFLIKRPAI